MSQVQGICQMQVEAQMSGISSDVRFVSKTDAKHISDTRGISDKR